MIEKNIVGSNFANHCQIKQFGLMKLFNGKNAAINSLEESYSLNEKSMTFLWKKIQLDSNISLLIGYKIAQEEPYIEQLKESVHFYE